MNGAALVVAATAVAAGKSASLLVAGLVATDSADPGSIATQGGIFAVAIAIGWFMLKRGDSREKDQAAAYAAIREADLHALRDEHAILRGELLTTRDKLIESLVDNAQKATQLAEQGHVLAELRVRIAVLEQTG